jgi:uncharacterized protein YycO
MYSKISTILITTILLLSLNTCTTTHTAIDLQPGDILFQDLDCGPFCDAVEKVTFGIKGYHFSHVAILITNQNGKPAVLEAAGKGVVETPLDTFYNRSKTPTGQPKIVIGRLKKQYQHLIPAALAKAQTLKGKKYDDTFDINNDTYYCSELLYFAFKTANNNKDFFPLYPMTFIDPDTKKTFPIWTQYYKDLNQPIPERKPGLNPGGISRDDKIDIIKYLFQ